MGIRVEKFLAENKKLLFILLLAAAFILPGISQVDWYDKFPWWAFLSFHDHPFLLFFVQHFFISLHESLFFAKLPYVLFSLGSVAILYWWMKEEYNEDMAQMSAIFLALNPLFIWTARTGF